MRILANCGAIVAFDCMFRQYWSCGNKYLSLFRQFAARLLEGQRGHKHLWRDFKDQT